MSEFKRRNEGTDSRDAHKGSTNHWYAVYTRSNYEKVVAEQLSSKGVENFLPVSRESHRWKDRKKVVEVPVFRSYVFARFSGDRDERLRVLQTVGSVRILGLGDRIEPIPDVEIDSVRRLLTEGKQGRPHQFLRKGCSVRVMSGPLAGLEGLFVRMKNGTDRLVVSVNLLRKAVSAEVDLADLDVLPTLMPNRLDTTASSGGPYNLEIRRLAGHPAHTGTSEE